MNKPDQSRDYHQRLLDGIMHNLLDGIVTVDSRGIILSANPAALSMTGYELEDILGKNIVVLMNPHMAKVHDDYIRQAVNSVVDPTGVIGNKRYLNVRKKRW